MYKEATHEISGDYSSASVIIPIINELKRMISQEEDDHGIIGMNREGCLDLLQKDMVVLINNHYVPLLLYLTQGLS